MMKRTHLLMLICLTAGLLGFDCRAFCQNELASIAFLGHYDNFGMLRESASYAALCRQYPQLESIAGFDVETGGEQTYLLIPKDKNASVAVNEYTFDMFLLDDESNAQVLYRSEEGSPILLHCNKADNISDVHIYVTSGRRTIDFQPQIDLNSGDLVPMNGVLDISPKGVFPLAEKHVELPTIQWQSMGISVLLKGGRVSVYYDAESVNNWIPEGVCAMNGWVGLKGINGTVKDILVADMGKERKPAIAMLMVDGSVRLFDLLGSLHGDPGNQYVSAPLEGVRDIVRLSSQSADGKARDYMAIFAFDAKGNQFELKPFAPCGSMDEYLKGSQAKEVIVALDPSGNIQLQLYDHKGNMILRQGTYFSSVKSVQKGVTTYQVRYHCTRLLQGSSYVYDVQDGELQLQVGPQNQVVLKPLKGNSLGIGLGKAIETRLAQ